MGLGASRQQQGGGAPKPKPKPVRIKVGREGALSEYGYGRVLETPPHARRAALERAVEAVGAVRVMRRLNAVQVLNRRRAPLAAALLQDRDWVGRTYLGWR